MHLHLAAVAVLWLAGSVILMPMMIIALRFAVIPLIEVFLDRSETTGRKADRERIERLEQRLAQILTELRSSGRSGTDGAAI